MATLRARSCSFEESYTTVWYYYTSRYGLELSNSPVHSICSLAAILMQSHHYIKSSADKSRFSFHSPNLQRSTPLNVLSLQAKPATDPHCLQHTIEVILVVFHEHHALRLGNTRSTPILMLSTREPGAALPSEAGNKPEARACAKRADDVAHDEKKRTRGIGGWVEG